MRPSFSRLTMAAGLAAMLVLVGGCAKIRSHQGYQQDRLVAESIAPGVDNKDSVSGALGTPTLVSQFGPEEWYYVSRETRQLAYSSPKPIDQKVLRIRFDAAGNVAAVDRMGMEQVARISPSGDKTPTLGRKRTLFQELFGNIGAVGAGGVGGGGSSGPGGGPNGS